MSDKILGLIQENYDDKFREIPIEFWAGYGYVCPGLGTTNGDLFRSVNLIENKLKDQESIKNEIKNYSLKITIGGERAQLGLVRNQLVNAANIL